MIQRFMVLQYWKGRRYLKYTQQYSKHRDQHVLLKLGRLLLLLLGLIFIHSLAMVYFEKLAWGDAFWLSATTATTVGYGDFSAASWQGRLFTIVCMYIFAIALLAQLAAEFVEYRIQARVDKHKGNWMWDDMKNHLLIINTPDENTDTYLDRLLGQIRATPEFEKLPIQILTRKYPNGLPQAISQHGVVHYNGVAENNENLAAVNVAEAKYIVILAKNAGDPMFDSLSFDVLNRIQELGTRAIIAAECSIDSNRERLKKAGATIVIRPIRAYPELLVRSLVAPGTEAVLENLFTHEESHMSRIDVSFSSLKWKDIVFSFVNNDFGMPMAYIDDAGVHSNPPPDQNCTGTGIISLIREEQEISVEQVSQCLRM
ncbi:MAG TPA: two pore domain potassium channel family protein [Porticoccus sp.]|nr:two pore domain potassium channel family protein [Porticoccus sp.]